MVKSRYIGNGHPPLIGNPYNGYVNPYYWVDEFIHVYPLLYGNNGSLDPGTYIEIPLKPGSESMPTCLSSLLRIDRGTVAKNWVSRQKLLAASGWSELPRVGSQVTHRNRLPMNGWKLQKSPTWNNIEKETSSEPHLHFWDSKC